jgi:hypothetical protein
MSSVLRTTRLAAVHPVPTATRPSMKNLSVALSPNERMATAKIYLGSV